MKKKQEDSLKNSEKLSMWDSFRVGSIAGIAEVSLSYPLWVLKTRKQAGLSFSLDPRVLYKGYIPIAVAMTPITTLQVFSSTAYNNISTNNFYYYQRIISGFLGGMFASILSAPTELGIIQQHKHHFRFFQALKKVMNVRGIMGIFSGIIATGIRDGVYTGAFYGAFPIVSERFSKYINNPFFLAVATGVPVGGIASLISHPWDVIKSQQQVIADEKHLSIKKSVSNIYKSGSMGFFRGLPTRTLGVTTAITTAGFVVEQLEQHFTNKPRPSPLPLSYCQ